MNVKLIGKHEKDSRACRDGLALTLNEMMAEDKSIVYVDCDLMGCINTKQLRKNYPERAFEAGIAEGNAAGVAAGLAATGKKVFFHSFGTFSSRRCYDQIYMSAAYAGLVGVDLTLADCCITLTLAQLPGVDGVRVTASGGGQSYRDRQALYPEDVLFSGAEETPVEVTAALYFRREGGDTLGYELRKFRLTEDSVPAKAVLSALIAGPEDGGLLPLLPQDLTVRSAWVEGGTCTADLSGRLLDLPPEERELALKSIVDTLCSLDTVERVQILIDGEPAGEFGGMDLSGPLSDPAGADG